MRLAVVLNQGGGKCDPALPQRLVALFRTLGFEADVRSVEPGGLAAAFAAAAATAPNALVAGGGDGTVSCGAGAAIDADLPLGVLPLGTFNHFARDAGIPPDLEGAAAVIAEGQSRAVDVAELNGRIFINNSAVGLYPMIVEDREAQQHRLGRSKRLAMIVASLRALRHFRRHRLDVRIAGREAPIDTPLLFVGNNRYETALLSMGRRARLDEGGLSIRALLVKSRLHLIGLALRGLFGRLDQQRDFANLDNVREAVIASPNAALRVSVDGETRLFETPLRYRIRPGALRLLAPSGPD
jgi:diacylglycerol kinase family enzyme